MREICVERKLPPEGCDTISTCTTQTTVDWISTEELAKELGRKEKKGENLGTERRETERERAFQKPC